MNSFISWIGGKNYLKKTIAEMIPDGLDRYVEVFGGAAWVMFYRDKYATQQLKYTMIIIVISTTYSGV